MEENKIAKEKKGNLLKNYSKNPNVKKKNKESDKKFIPDIDRVCVCDTINGIGGGTGE